VQSPKNEVLTADMMKVKCPNDRTLLIEHAPYRVLTYIDIAGGRPSRILIPCPHCEFKIGESQYGTHLLNKHSCQRCNKIWSSPREDRVIVSNACHYELCPPCSNYYFQQEPPRPRMTFECPGLGSRCPDWL
jgi:hypothetical protein